MGFSYLSLVWFLNKTNYQLEDRVISGKELAEDGIFMEKFSYNDCRTIELRKI